MNIDRPSLVVFVRHAESERNKKKRGSVYLPEKEELPQGRRGTPDHKVKLTPEGRQQALHTGVRLREIFGSFDVAYHSGYVRTEDSLDAILQAYTDEERAQIKIRESFYLREREPGYTYDMTQEEVDAQLPWYRGYFEEVGYFYSQPPGGESQALVCQRVYTFNGIMFKHRAGMKVLVLAHGGTIRAARFNLEKWSVARYEEEAKKGPTPNCGVTEYRYNPESGRLDLASCDTIYY